MTRQLIFDLPVRSAQGREDFFISPSNAHAVAALDGPEGWPNGKFMLIGPAGAGKSHLAAVWAACAGAAVIAARDLTDADAPGLAEIGAVIVEDAQEIAGIPAGEAALFHLHNLVLASGGRLLLTTDTPPNAWGLCLPDLASRMQATATATLAAPDDALLAAVLVKLFADRQIVVPPALIPYLVARIDRSFATARALVAALDSRALALRRPITMALAAELLDRGLPDAP